MCGIAAYIGNKSAYPLVLNGLKKLEYRGYDSAGVSLFNQELTTYKVKGKVKLLEKFCSGKNISGNVGLGHTRWATHGEPCTENAHPHVSSSGSLALVHNGIIENYASLKSFLEAKKIVFKSETDSEVLVQYIEWYKEVYEIDTFEAIRRVMEDLEGSYAFVVFDKNSPGKLYAAKKDNPLVIGKSRHGFYICSDAGPASLYSDQVAFLEDDDICMIDITGEVHLINNNNAGRKLEFSEMEEVHMDYDLGEYSTFMQKEIFQQSESLSKCLEGRIDLEAGKVYLEAIDNHRRIFENARRIVIVACGTSWHSALIAEYMIESIARVPVEVEYASEFRYRNPIINESDVVIAISQSGETADTLAALKLANFKGAFTYSIVNVRNSTISRNSDVVSYLNIGNEVGVASTKAFTGQVSLLNLIALKLADIKGVINAKDLREYVNMMSRVPEYIEQTLSMSGSAESIADILKDKTSALFLGRGINFPTALESALKLKEVSYIHAEGYPAAEMKHGPIALVDENLPVIINASNLDSFQKLMANVEEIKSRKGIVILIKRAGSEIDERLYDYAINLPEAPDFIMPILSCIPMQIIAYHTALMRGCNVDQPRNLAKSVTVE